MEPGADLGVREAPGDRVEHVPLAGREHRQCLFPFPGGWFIDALQVMVDELSGFVTIQTLSRDANLAALAPDLFDYILIDEVHKAGAATYQKVIDHFKPDFLLGMTATPERTDGFNIYELFDYNVAYEIRLQEALDEDMLCPFMYYGVKDIELDGQLLNETSDF